MQAMRTGSIADFLTISFVPYTACVRESRPEGLEARLLPKQRLSIRVLVAEDIAIQLFRDTDRPSNKVHAMTRPSSPRALPRRL